MSEKETKEALGKDQLAELSGKLGDGWKVVEAHHLEKSYSFDDFRQALAFTNRVGEAAEQQDHHPDIYLTYGEVRVKIWTHTVDGLTTADFALAARADEML